MVKKSVFRKKDRGVAAVVGALLLASMGITLFASFTLWYVPYTTTHNEQAAFTSQSSSFVSLSHQIYSGLQPGQVIAQSVKLGAPGAPPFTQSSQSQISFVNGTYFFSGSVSYAFTLTLANTTTSGTTTSGTYNATYKGTFNFSSTITANSTFTSGQKGILYLADGSSVNTLGGTTSVVSGVPIDIYSGSGGSISLAFLANSLGGKSVSVSSYGSSIIKLQSVKNTAQNFTVGEVLDLLGVGSIPYSAVVQNINLTAFTYTINGPLSTPFFNAFKSQFGTSSAVSAGSISIIDSANNLASVSLKAGSYIPLTSISVQLAELIVNSI